MIRSRVSLAMIDAAAMEMLSASPLGIRFWKMVGKGYVYSMELQNFFYQETSNIIKEDSERFRRDISHYLSAHLYSFDDVYHGAIAIMGYEWAHENVFKVKGEVTERQALIHSERDQHTFHP